ncbi:hypothetical protein Tco_0491902 [Tanacetum coccineum]
MSKTLVPHMLTDKESRRDWRRKAGGLVVVEQMVGLTELDNNRLGQRYMELGLSRDSSQEGERAVIEPSPQPSRQRAESTAKMSAHVARSHGGDGGGDDRPPSHVVPTGCGGCFSNRGRGKRKPNLGGRAAGRLNTRDKTRNLSLKDIAETKGPVPITFEMSDMIALLNDLSYIPPNNEQNEPIQEDIGETSNEPTQAKRNEFEELYASANEELYPGCDYVTRLDFMAKFTYFKVKGKLTDSIFNEILEFFQHVFPTTKGYKLPPSYYAIKKTFKTIGLGYESIHACVNDCFLFRGDNNKDLHFCPVCKTSRWKDSNTPGKKVPKKVLRYFPIIPRLQRLYKSSHTAKEMTWHATEEKPRNVRLGLAADGFNPFGNLSQAYSMWPVILTTYNLPPWLCMKESSFMLTLLIPGPKSPGKDIDVYLRPLIDDLKVLWALKGVETIDVDTGAKMFILERWFYDHQ